MWTPRIISILAAGLATFGMYELMQWQNQHHSLPDDAWAAAAIVAQYTAWSGASLVGMFLGYSGIAASFALELDANGKFRPKNNWYGRVMGTPISGAKSFCGASVMCGALMLTALFVPALFAGIVLAVSKDPLGFFFFMACAIGALSAFVAVGVGIILLCRKYALARKVGSLFAILALAAGVGFVGYQVYDTWTHAPPFEIPDDPRFWAVPLAIVATVLSLIGGFYLVKVYARRTRWYERMCPMSASTVSKTA